MRNISSFLAFLLGEASKRQLCFYPAVYNVLGDSRDEIIVWSKSAVLIGTNPKTPSKTGPSFRNNKAYKLRHVNKAVNRSSLYFSYQTGSGDVTGDEPTPAKETSIRTNFPAKRNRNPILTSDLKEKNRTRYEGKRLFNLAGRRSNTSHSEKSVGVYIIQ